ncbi:unnamed protein product [Lota lota]
MLRPSSEIGSDPSRVPPHLQQPEEGHLAIPSPKPLTIFITIIVITIPIIIIIITIIMIITMHAVRYTSMTAAIIPMESRRGEAIACQQRNVLLVTNSLTPPA